MIRDGPILAAVALGSALGAVARYLFSLMLLDLAGPGFPWGTLAVNVSGSFLIGLYAALVAGNEGLATRHVLRHFIMTGICGGFTTFSVFSLETIYLIERQAVGLAGIYIGLSLVLWLVAVWLGYQMGLRLLRSRTG